MRVIRWTCETCETRNKLRVVEEHPPSQELTVRCENCDSAQVVKVVND